MKKAYIYLTSFLCISVFFTICYYWSYNRTIKEWNNRIEQQSQVKEMKPFLEEQIEKIESIEKVDTRQEEITTPDTKYQLVTVDIHKNTTKTEQLNIPEYFVGMKREEIIEYLKQYIADMPLEEFKKGLLSYELESFSKEQIIVKKTYDSSPLKYEFYLVVQAGYLVVYYSDKKTVYEYTDIEAAKLPIEEQRKLSFGIYIENKELLYSILESYSS